MPVYSMTGYASVQGQDAETGPGEDSRAGRPATRFGLEIRSVNSRFLDLNFRLPDELRQLEPELRGLLAEKLRRGKVELRIAAEALGAELPAEPSPRVLQRLAVLQDTVRAWIPDAQPVGMADILRFSAATKQPASDAASWLLPVARQLIDRFQGTRAAEGEKLARMIIERVADLHQLVEKAKPLVPQLVDLQRTRFLQRWNDAMSAATGDNAASGSSNASMERALLEATAYAIRIDIAEEIDRLTAHLQDIEKLVKEGGAIGKRLDFVIQELHREANTLGSKSGSLELTRISVEMKVLIEQMREQVQNIE